MVKQIARRGGYADAVTMRFCLLPIAAFAAAAHAGTVEVTVRGPDGQPLPDAVVMIETPGRSDAASRFPGPFRMAQQNIAFQPHMLIVPVGAVVTFPNLDRVRHHVYSFSTAKKFELKLYGHEEARTVIFDRAGVVALGCNIHDRMSGFIIVTATPFTATTDAAGRVSIPAVPAGRATLRIWHQALRAPGGELAQPFAVTAAPLAKAVTVPLR
jgi:plastocyanin